MILITYLGLVATMHGVFGQPKSPRRALLFGVGGFCGMLLIHTSLNLLVNPAMSPLGYLVPVLMPILFFVMLKLKWIEQQIRTDERRGARTGEWESLDLVNN